MDVTLLVLPSVLDVDANLIKEFPGEIGEERESNIGGETARPELVDEVACLGLILPKAVDLLFFELEGEGAVMIRASNALDTSEFLSSNLTNCGRHSRACTGTVERDRSNSTTREK